ncbi:MAG: YebC/PmpR family DNA-binding transcriptional regulator [Phycisphaerales bacterium]|jgi:YebC/PmpR family DNA-binding regulatory protein
MAGHSAWKNIKHRKAAVDAKRGRIWSKLSRAIIVAARNGGSDPKFNAVLRLAILDAKAGNMPRETIEKAVKKGAGETDGERFEPVRYEGYGPGGVAVIVEALTSNVNRTAPEIRAIFDKNDGKLGVPGSVAFSFQQRGVLLVSATAAAEDKLMEVAIEAGADDVSSMDEGFQVLTEPAQFGAVRETLEARGIVTESAEVAFLPVSPVEIDETVRAKLEKLVDALEEHDDVQKVHTSAA